MNIKSVGLAVGFAIAGLNCGGAPDTGGAPADDETQMRPMPVMAPGSSENPVVQRPDETRMHTMTVITRGDDGSHVIHKSPITIEQYRTMMKGKLEYERLRKEGSVVRQAPASSPSNDSCIDHWNWLWMHPAQYQEGDLCCAYWPEGAEGTISTSEECGFTVKSYYSGDQDGEFRRYGWPYCADPFATNELEDVAPCQDSNWLRLYPLY